MDKGAAEVLVWVVGGLLGFSWVLGMTRQVIGDDGRSKAIIFLVAGIVGYGLMGAIGATVKDLPSLPGVTPDDLGGFVAFLPWKAIDDKLGEGFTLQSILVGAAFAGVFELYNFMSRRDKAEP